MMNCNTDGASRGNSGNSSFVFFLTDMHGDLLYTQGDILEDINNMEVEAVAILQVAKHCKQSKNEKVVIQTNLLSMQKILNKEWDNPWSVADNVQKILQLLSSKQVQFQQILREDNQLVDYFTNIALVHGEFTFIIFKQLHASGKKIINSDKL